MFWNNSRNSKKRQGQEGFSLVSAIFSILLLAALGLGMSAVASSMARGSVYELQGQQAFYVADGGLQYILMKEFVNDDDYSNNTSPTGSPFGGTPITLGNGQFWVQYANSTVTTVDITVTGKVGEGVRQVAQHTISTFTNQAPVTGLNVVVLNGPGQVHGAVRAMSNVNISNGFVVDPGPVIENDPNVVLPTVDMASLIALTTSTAPNLNLSNNDVYTGNVHVTGNVNIGHHVTINGIIVSDGQINLDHTLTLNGTLASGNSISSNSFQNCTLEQISVHPTTGKLLPVLVSDGNITLTTGQHPVGAGTPSNIHGVVLTDNNLNITKKAGGDIIVFGYLMGRQEVNLKADTGVIDVTPDLSLAPLITGNDTVKLTQWQEQ